MVCVGKVESWDLPGFGLLPCCSWLDSSRRVFTKIGQTRANITLREEEGGRSLLLRIRYQTNTANLLTYELFANRRNIPFSSTTRARSLCIIHPH